MEEAGRLGIKVERIIRSRVRGTIGRIAAGI